MNTSSTAGFASGPRSRWDDFWRSFPAQISMILQPKLMMPCLHAGMLIIPSQGWKQLWTECHTWWCVSLQHWYAQKWACVCSTCTQQLGHCCWVTSASIGHTPCTPAHRLQTKLWERRLQLLYKLSPRGKKSDSKGILHGNSVISCSRSQRQSKNLAVYVHGVRLRMWRVPRRWVTSSRWQQWATAAGCAPFSSRCTQAPEVSLSSASDQQIYKTICLGTNCTQPSQFCCPDLHHTQTIQGLLWIS